MLATEDGKSSPEHVLARLKDFVKEYDIGDDDELWLCLDVDHWANSGHIQNLTSVLQQCKAARYQIAFCLPCFELWLLLHYREIDTANLTGHTALSVSQDLKQHCCGFDKTKVDRMSLSADQVLSAMKRAKLLPGDNMDIPTAIAAQTHRLLNRLVEKESICIDPPKCQSGLS